MPARRSACAAGGWKGSEMHRRSLLALGAAFLARPALAQAWPAERSIRYVVPVAPGGSQDIVARLFARHLTDALGQCNRV